MRDLVFLFAAGAVSSGIVISKLEAPSVAADSFTAIRSTERASAEPSPKSKRVTASDSGETMTAKESLSVVVEPDRIQDRRIFQLMDLLHSEKQVRDQIAANSGLIRPLTVQGLVDDPRFDAAAKKMRFDLRNFVEDLRRIPTNEALLFEAEFVHRQRKYHVHHYVLTHSIAGPLWASHYIKTFIRSGNRLLHLQVQDFQKFGALDWQGNLIYAFDMEKCETSIARELGLLQINYPDMTMQSKVSVLDAKVGRFRYVATGDWRKVDQAEMERMAEETWDASDLCNF